MATEYEWVVECMVDGEVDDIFHCASYAMALHEAREDDCIALHKAVNNRNGDPLDLAVSAYAYVTDGILPAKFDNGDKVPKRFIMELLSSS